ncbi:MAG: hypothetical protein OEM52_10510 [bacterium]|nr:hypothetical protein [bacterium]
MTDCSKYTIALAQINPKIGDWNTNLTKHLEYIERAKSQGALIIVFPELSLSGYMLRDLAGETARSVKDAFFKPLCQASDEITIVCGGVELSRDFTVYNSIFVFEEGKHIHTHRKVYLPTYSVFEEKRFYGEGDRVRTFDTRWGRMGGLICNDLWHPPLLWLLNLQGAELVVVPTASPLRGLGEVETSEAQRIFRLLCETGAKTNTLYIALVNLVGWQDGLFFWGESALYGPNGKALSVASTDSEQLLLLEVDREWLRRERIATPLRRDERVDLIARELALLRSRHQSQPFE